MDGESLRIIIVRNTPHVDLLVPGHIPGISMLLSERVRSAAPTLYEVFAITGDRSK